MFVFFMIVSLKDFRVKVKHFLAAVIAVSLATALFYLFTHMYMQERTIGFLAVVFLAILTILFFSGKYYSK